MKQLTLSIIFFTIFSSLNFAQDINGISLKDASNKHSNRFGKKEQFCEMDGFLAWDTTDEAQIYSISFSPDYNHKRKYYNRMTASELEEFMAVIEAKYNISFDTIKRVPEQDYVLFYTQKNGCQYMIIHDLKIKKGLRKNVTFIIRSYHLFSQL
ncbi:MULTISPECIES: hypothetical protein [Flammeovirga]|uniref:Uncharacterized protein n=1 Tax=Flammeovirga agarivorans TaxID=2726742 RepID=A0A7X8XXJ0_9BACT|nr:MULTISPECIES: hypothetical protein [Flammeovirga]NLR93289.1 hypothetical protein [Flammeovirga agarivorans]